jgi:hypothetical protein
VEPAFNRGLRLAGLFTLGLALVVFFVVFVWSFQYLPGTDAYYYALQAQSILDTAHLKVPDHGAVYYVVAALTRLGLPIETAFRASLTAIFLLYQAGVLLLVLRTKKTLQAIAALLWALSSPLIAFHAIEFPNLTLALATTPIWFSLAITPTQRSRFYLAALLVAAAIVHPVAAVLAVFFGVIVLGFDLAKPLGSIKNAFRTRALFAMAGAAVLLVWAAFIYLGITLRFSSLLRAGPPALVGLVRSSDIPNELKLTVLSFWSVLALLFIIGWRILDRKWKLLALLCLALPLFPDDLSGLAGVGGRLAIAFIFPSLPLIVGLSHQFARDTPVERFPRVPVLNRKWSERFAVIAVAIAATLFTFRMEAYRPLLIVDDYGTYEKVVTALKDAKIPMLIAHRGLDFFYTYRLRQDAFHFDPEPGWNRAEIWRVAARITPEEIAFYSAPTCPWGETAKVIRDTEYILVREDCWEQLRIRLKRDDNPDLYTEVWEDMENPSQPRPAFLRERHRDAGTESLSQPIHRTTSQ